MEKRKLKKLEEILLHHLMHLNLPIERYEIQDDVVIIQWMDGKYIKESRYEL